VHLLDLSLSAPSQNLALDELLLLQAEDGAHDEVLRWWESPLYFVVLGAGGQAKSEVHTEACAREGVAVLRRCSGGGTVLQGRGCLNYTMVVDREARRELHTIDATNQLLLAQVRAALAAGGVATELQGISDLTYQGLKVSGNAQRRRKRWILFHGTILYNFDLALVSRYLMEPEKRPDYRGERQHDAFIANVPVDVAKFKAALQQELGAHAGAGEVPIDQQRLRQLLDEKYDRDAWNLSL